MIATKTLDAINKQLEGSQDSSHRTHLGASLIGSECARKLWYIFRHVKTQKHKGQLLRLFQRGHLEEFRFTKYLEDIGVQVWDTDPDTGKQYQVSDCCGHFGGSLDGIGYGIPELPNEYVLLEYKTHGEKSFKKLVSEGLLGSKWEHYVQMQVYMKKKGLGHGLYMAVNKNTDELHCEVVQCDPAIGERYIDRAKDIIFAVEAPARVSNNRGWFSCKWCAFQDICHGDELPERNCRTCKHLTACEDKQWFCQSKQSNIETTDPCSSYELDHNLKES